MTADAGAGHLPRERLHDVLRVTTHAPKTEAVDPSGPHFCFVIHLAGRPAGARGACDCKKHGGKPGRVLVAYEVGCNDGYVRRNNDHQQLRKGQVRVMIKIDTGQASTATMSRMRRGIQSALN